VEIRKETFIVPQLWFFTSIALSFIAWGIITARYVWPELRLRPRAEALRPLLILHSFRFIGLAFLVPGVVSPDLPPAFDLKSAPSVIPHPLSSREVTGDPAGPADRFLKSSFRRKGRAQDWLSPAHFLACS
jgi:hypothetical protein